MKSLFLIFSLLLIPSLAGITYGHTIDAVEEYRIEIGWMNEPVVSGETNGLELYISPLIPCPDISISMECANSQEFQNGIEGLKKFIKIQFVFDKTEKITLPLSPDHNIPGKYYAFVNPTVSGYYQANIIGKILDTSINLSMHPPPVAERSYIEFPESSDLTLTQIIDGHTKIIEDMNNLKNSVQKLEKSDNTMNIGYVGIIIGIIGTSFAIIALIKTRKN
ncbi:MAG: hypothetical protein HON30_01320 [Nitrosopumilus sp.]|jgi:hypothetical protein|nr:hypothetical protein [Nitrosopumilus sp.]